MLSFSKESFTLFIPIIISLIILLSFIVIDNIENTKEIEIDEQKDMISINIEDDEKDIDEIAKKIARENKSFVNYLDALEMDNINSENVKTILFWYTHTNKNYE